MDKSKQRAENSPQNGDNPQSKQISVSGVVVLVMLKDGSLHQAEVAQPEHLRTILNICTMNEKKGLLLGKTDLAPALKEHLTMKEDDDASGMPEETS